MKPFTRIQTVFRSVFAGEDGQMLVMAALVMVVMLGFAALAIDVGFFLHTKRDIQNGADAMALAGVRELPNTSDAQAVAMEWAAKNSVAGAEVKSIVFGTTCSGESIDGTVTVRLQRTQNTFLAKVVGVSKADLKACATARRGAAVGGPDLLPFGFLYDDPNLGTNACYYDDNPDLWTESCVLKIPSPSDTWTPGNTGPLRLDEGGPGSNYDGGCNTGGSGASEYKENIMDGSECKYAPGDAVTPKTGSMVGPTCDAFNTKFAGNSDSFSDVFSEKENGVYTVVDMTSPRFGIIPVVKVDPSASGSSVDIEIVTFITVYVSGNCVQQGNQHATITVVPAKSSIYMAGLEFAGGGGVQNTTDWPLYTIKLID